MTPALYVHIPFCAKKCAYCDFESHAGRLSDADAYISRVLDEARTRKSEYGISSVYSLYLGGGTPSLLTDAQLSRLTEGLNQLFPPAPGAEVTLEANPGTLTPSFLKTARRLGFNRLSLGVQARQEKLLRMLGRIHRFEDAASAVSMARDAGFQNISCDVMNELPGQTPKDLTETLDAIIALQVQHISCYGLILEEGTPLYMRVTQGELALPDEDTASALNLLAARLLEENGYHRYEISNFALPGCESRHNIVYWTGGDYLGLGAAAHSFMRRERFANPGLDEYLSGVSRQDAYLVDEKGALEESILLGTRMTRGISLTDIAVRYGAQTEQALRCKAQELKGLVNVHDGCLSFTQEGFLLHSALVVELVSAVENAVGA